MMETHVPLILAVPQAAAFTPQSVVMITTPVPMTHAALPQVASTLPSPAPPLISAKLPSILFSSLAFSPQLIFLTVAQLPLDVTPHRFHMMTAMLAQQIVATPLLVLSILMSAGKVLSLSLSTTLLSLSSLLSP
jgi:hypothetical protein